MWKEEKNQPDSKAEFVPNTGSQVNIKSGAEATRHNMEMVRLIDAGNNKKETKETAANWKQIEVLMTSNKREKTHREDVHITRSNKQ